MDLYVTDSGRRTTPNFPPDELLASWPEIAELAEKAGNARRLEREHQETLAAEATAETALAESVATDRAELAAARFKGSKKLPDLKGVQAARDALEEAKRQREAADAARRLGAAAAVACLEANRASWLRTIEEAEEKARAEEAKRLASYLEGVDARSLVAEFRRWLADFPTRRAFKPGAGALAHVDRREAIGWETIVRALRIRAGVEAPPPRTLEEQVEARGLVPAPEIGGPARGAAA